MKQIPVIDMKATGKNIVRLREEAGLSVKEFAYLLGFESPQAVYKWQCGINIPSVDNLLIMAAVLGTTMEEIVVTVLIDINENNIDRHRCR
ncbi:MAG: helix-turn-helix transcriptional regulator [Lachnospiraceae bacterium]|nr:helix-turn-helix transcriptional regulator [Lachnospiraceae bacterium]